MPNYEFKCNQCNSIFNLFLQMSERDNVQKCPFCNTKNTARVFTAASLTNLPTRGSNKL